MLTVMFGIAYAIYVWTDAVPCSPQALLEQFGIPYVVSPKEAEAQCAFLEIAGLTDG